MRYLRLFSAFVTPGMIVEHPDDLPTDYDSIPLGPIKDWECYAPNMGGGGPKEVYGPFEAEVVLDCGSKAIKVKYGPYREYHFYFRNGKEGEGISRAHWFQSAYTLRFIKRRETDSSSV